MLNFHFFNKQLSDYKSIINFNYIINLIFNILNYLILKKHQSTIRTQLIQIQKKESHLSGNK